MLMRRNVAAGIGSKGSIVERLCSDLDRKEPRYKSPTLLFTFTLTLSPERQSARMSKITNDGIIRSGTSTGCFIAVPVWQ